MRNDVRVQGEEDLSPGTECLCWRGVWDSESVWYIHTGAGGGGTSRLSADMGTS